MPTCFLECRSAFDLYEDGWREHLPTDFAGDLKRYKYRGSSGKVNLALDGLPNFTAKPGADRTCAAPFRFRPALTTWNEPTMKPSMVATRAVLTSIS